VPTRRRPTVPWLGVSSHAKNRFTTLNPESKTGGLMETNRLISPSLTAAIAMSQYQLLLERSGPEALSTWTIAPCQIPNTVPRAASCSVFLKVGLITSGDVCQNLAQLSVPLSVGPTTPAHVVNCRSLFLRVPRRHSKLGRNPSPGELGRSVVLPQLCLQYPTAFLALCRLRLAECSQLRQRHPQEGTQVHWSADRLSL